jgi:alkylation response protein AidB-like acyl-CoA dehydrogenase
MELFLKEEHRQVREMARKFADEVVAPQSRRFDEEEDFPTEVVKQMAELGFLGCPSRRRTAAPVSTRSPT